MHPEALDVAPERMARMRRLVTIPALDGLRGAAVLIVVVEHLQTISIPGVVTISAGPFRGAFLGVDIFFVLSGFLITALLLGEQLEHGRVSIGAFYWRRALRLLPALLFLLGAHSLYAWSTGLSMRVQWMSVRGALAYVSNWTWKWDGFESASGLGHLWSLSVEEQFYLLWPALLIAFFGIRRHTGWVVSALVALIVAVAVRRAVMWEDGTSWFFLFIRTDTRADSLLVGALLGQLWVRGWTPRRWLGPAAWTATAVLVVTMVFARSDRAFLHLGGFTLVAVCTAAVILAAADGRWAGTQLLQMAPLQAIGRVSYGLYLWHMPVFDVVNRYGAGWGAPARVITSLAVTAAVTVGSWKLLERPFLTLKDRVGRGSTRHPVIVPVAAGKA